MKKQILLAVAVCLFSGPIHASSYAVVGPDNTVLGVYEFFGTPEWPKEPADELAAIAVIESWNDKRGNPLNLQPGDRLRLTYPSQQEDGFRGKFAGKGDTWHDDLSRFIPPKPYESWTFNMQKNAWESPVELPRDVKIPYWDENKRNWVVAAPQDIIKTP